MCPLTNNRLWFLVALSALVGVVLVVALLTIGRPYLRTLLRPEPPAPLTPLALAGAAALPTTPSQLPATAPVKPTLQPSATVAPSVSTPLSSSTALPLPPTPIPPTPVPATPTPAAPTPVVVGDRRYTVLLPTANKPGQLYSYTCEFDAGWVVLQSYGFDVSVEELIERMPYDTSIEPYIEETANGFLIYGGDITSAYSGDYAQNFLARTTGAGFAPVFHGYGLETQPVNTREALEVALLRGELVWMKTTVDFKPWRPATWITPSGAQIKTVLGNDHAVVVMGFNDEVVVIRDVLGPTSTGAERPLEYEVRWDTFMAAWGAQDYDAIAVARP